METVWYGNTKKKYNFNKKQFTWLFTVFCSYDFSSLLYFLELIKEHMCQKLERIKPGHQQCVCVEYTLMDHWKRSVPCGGWD
jgi:hypothetical protein